MPKNIAGGLLRARGPELFLEAFFIVFAVLVALGVDEWNEGRELREQADLARTSVIAELEGNREELRRGAPSTVAMLERVTETVLELRRGGELTSADIQGELPDFSDAAWETARVTGAMARMEYEWVLETARVYEAQELTLDLQRDLFRTIGSLVVRPPDLERFTELRGQLVILTLLHKELGLKYEALLSQEGPSP